MKNSLKILILSFFPFFLAAQLPNKQETGVLMKREFYGGLTLTTNGWGVNFSYGRQKNVRYKALYGIDIGNIRNKKEYKSFSTFLNKSKSYYYGKLNSLLVFRPFYGGKVLLFEKKRENATEIDFVWATGFSLGLLKPVYLKIRELDKTTSVFHNVEERYDPAKHYPENIYGRAPWYKGLSESKLLPGIFVKVGFNFDISTRKSRLWGIEIGGKADIYFQTVPLMYNTKNYSIFPAFYANITLGKRMI